VGEDEEPPCTKAKAPRRAEHRECGLCLADCAAPEALLHKGPLSISEIQDKVLLASAAAGRGSYPGYAHTFNEIGKERGWPPATRAQFDALRGPTGALLIGDAETVAQKILYVNEVLGGLARITFRMGASALPHQKMLRSIELTVTRAAPIVREEPTAVTSRS
jgi:hypothetical protein